MQSVIEFLKRNGIYVVLVLAIVFQFGLALNKWGMDDPTWGYVETAFMFLGLASVRAKLSDLFAGVDLGAVGVFINGYKTYIFATAAFIWQIGLASQWWVLGNPVWGVVNTLMQILGVGSVFTLGQAALKYQKKVLAMPERDRHYAFIKRAA